jgi:hypothetical protein
MNRGLGPPGEVRAPNREAGRGAEDRRLAGGTSVVDTLPRPADTTVEPHRSPLRQTLDVAIDEAAMADVKLSMKDLTVLAVQNDPFRLDTPASHRDGEWLAITARELGLGDRKIHLRGLHYMMIGRPKPDGTVYTNTDADWLWLSAGCGKAARFLRYIPFDQIVDQRNAAPVVRIFERKVPWPYLSVGIDVDIPAVDDIEPRIGVGDFIGVQPYKLVMIGEKSSLDDVLGPIAESYEADLYLPTGEISDTLIYQMAKIGAEDGRPMVVLYFADADPAGWQMPISVARKLQAFKAFGAVPVPGKFAHDGHGDVVQAVVDFGSLDFQVHRVALTPDQVREYGLPSTPLKDTERRGDAWQAAKGVEQTEIDALASLQPDLLRRIARDAIAPFRDASLDRRVYEARSQWITEAQAIVDEAVDQDHLDRLRAEAGEKLAELRVEIDAVNDALRLDARDFDLPVPVVPTADIDGTLHPLPLLDSSWSFAEQCRALIDSKAYRNGGPS